MAKKKSPKKPPERKKSTGERCGTCIYLRRSEDFATYPPTIRFHCWHPDHLADDASVEERNTPPIFIGFVDVRPLEVCPGKQEPEQEPEQDDEQPLLSGL